MDLAVPRLRMQLRLWKLCVLVALCALGIWGGLFFLSPTRRLTRQIQPDQPTYLRREAVGGLGYVPFWEADQAIGVLIEALGDPSPRVRENALSGLGAHGVRARRAVPAILAAGNDDDRNVRYTAFAVLGVVISPERRDPERDAVVAALKLALDDRAPENRMAAAISLLQLREDRMAFPTTRTDRDRARRQVLDPPSSILRGQYGTNAELSAWVVPLLRDQNEARRQRAWTCSSRSPLRTWSTRACAMPLETTTRKSAAGQPPRSIR